MLELIEVFEKFKSRISHERYQDDDLNYYELSKYAIIDFPNFNIQFIKQTVGSFYLKCELIEYFNLQDFLFNQQSLADKKDTDWIRMMPSDKLYQLLFSISDKIFEYHFANSAGRISFACCNSFNECSDNLKCINSDRNLYLGCAYRKNLEHGKVFYGRNARNNPIQ